MYWILLVMAGIVSLVIAVVVGGVITPRAHEVSRTMLLPAPIASVWAVIRDVAHYAEWRDGVVSSEIVDADQSQLRWCESSDVGVLTFGVTMDHPMTDFSARVLDRDLAYTREWSWRLTSTGDGTRVTMTERGEVPNVISRFIVAHITGHARGVDRYLKDLTHRVGSASVIAHVALPNDSTL